MKLFYAEELLTVTELTGNEHRHLRASRVREGDTVYITDGRGNSSEAVVQSLGKRKAILNLTDILTASDSSSQFVHLIVAPTKNVQRMEWMVEKCTEIGVDRISFVHCRQSERSRLKYDRLHRKAISAMKQSLKFYYPEIDEMVNFEDFLLANEAEESLSLIAHLYEDSVSIKEIIEHKDNSDIQILIGPEGDFHPEEVELATEKGWKSVHLGPSRLRTETAAITSVGFCYYNGL